MSDVAMNLGRTKARLSDTPEGVVLTLSHQNPQSMLLDLVHLNQVEIGYLIRFLQETGLLEKLER